MPAVYEVLFDNSFQSLDPVDRRAFLAERRRSWKFDGYPVEDSWRPLDVYFRRPTLKKPDIWQLVDTLAFEPQARRIVQGCLDESGEQLALPFEDRELTVLNVTYVIDCLDQEQSSINPKLSAMIYDYVFHPDRLDYSLFKIPETRWGQILTVEGLASPEDEFKPLVERHGLKGLKFKKLYSWE